MKQQAEIDKEAQRLIKTSIISFSVSFIIGTLILQIYHRSEDPDASIITGFFFVVAAFFTNTILLINNLINMGKSREYRRKFFFASLLLLLNLPISVYYFLSIANP